MSEDRKQLMIKETSSWLNSPVKSAYKPKHGKKIKQDTAIVFSAGLITGMLLFKVLHYVTR